MRDEHSEERSGDTTSTGGDKRSAEDSGDTTSTGGDEHSEERSGDTTSTGGRFELIAATDPPKVDVRAEYPEVETDDVGVTITDPWYSQQDTDGTDDDVRGAEPTHECQSCGTGQHIDTPYSSLDAWCESCDAVRNHTKIDE